MTDTQRQHYQTLLLAALWLDLGKLWLQPGSGAGQPPPLLAAEFLQEAGIGPRLQEQLGQELDPELLHHLVLRHDPQVTTGREWPEAGEWLDLLRQANLYAAGARDQAQLYQNRPPAGLALTSIFARRYLGRPVTDPGRHYRPAPLSPAAAFPEAPAEAITAQGYAEVRDAFRQGLAYALAQAETWPALEAWVYSLLERYTWAIPSDFNLHTPDVSIFDHARTACALAAALYLYRRAGAPAGEPEFLLIKGDISGVQDYLYSIANVGPGGVAKRLRARSFFITALTEVVAHRLRDELVAGFPLPLAAIIMSGGGQFVLLAPNLPEVKTALARLKQELNTWLWHEFQGDLAFVFGRETLSGAELALQAEDGGRTISQVLAGLDHKTEQAKAGRLGNLLRQAGRWQPDRFQWTFEAYTGRGACPSCERLPARAGEEEPDIDKRLCWHCLRDRQLSETIVKARYIAYWQGQPPQVNGHSLEPRRHLVFFEGEGRRTVALLAGLEDLARFDRPPYQLDTFGYEEPTPESPPVVRHFANYVPRFDSKDQLETFCTAGRGCAFGRYFDQPGRPGCGLLVRPIEAPGSVRPDDFPVLRNFGCLSAAAAEHEDGTLGMQLLGILRADVDNLGLLFSDSFVEKVAGSPTRRPVRSLARLATLSRMIDLFFSGWVHQALETDERYRNIYTVYAGGDDLCLVGPWDTLIEFTRTLAAAFERYTTGNPNLSFSAAITVVKPKFPLATATRRAGTLLKAAKNAGRNRLNLFGVIARWRDLPPYEDLDPGLAAQLKEREKHSLLLVADLWPWAGRLDDQLGHYRRERGQGRRYPISRSFALRLLQYAEMARAWEQAEEIRAEDMLYLARLAYDLGRNIIRQGGVEPDVVEKLLSLTQLQQRRLMAGMRLPLTYALYRNRERSSDTDGR